MEGALQSIMPARGKLRHEVSRVPAFRERCNRDVKSGFQRRVDTTLCGGNSCGVCVKGHEELLAKPPQNPEVPCGKCSAGDRNYIAHSCLVREHHIHLTFYQYGKVLMAD